MGSQEIVEIIVNSRYFTDWMRRCNSGARRTGPGQDLLQLTYDFLYPDADADEPDPATIRKLRHYLYRLQEKAEEDKKRQYSGAIG